MKFTNSYIKLNKTFEKAEKAVAVTIITTIVLIVFAGTVARYALKEPLFGADRLATYLMVWLGFIGFQIATSKLRHIEIEFIKARVKSEIRYLMSSITCFIAFVFLLILFWISVEHVMMSKEMGDRDIVLGLELWIIILILPISFFISSIRFLFSGFLWIDVIKGRRKEEEIFVKQLL
jgi:TRAP-type C4-dicarboxylate transport system permease small subunit